VGQTRSEDGSTHLEAGPDAIGPPRLAPPAELNSVQLAGRDAVPPAVRGVERGWGVGGGRVV
jgi:hypothetical protein